MFIDNGSNKGLRGALKRNVMLLYPDSGISMDEESVLGSMIWSYNKAEL